MDPPWSWVLQALGSGPALALLLTQTIRLLLASPHPGGIPFLGYPMLRRRRKTDTIPTVTPLASSSVAVARALQRRTDQDTKLPTAATSLSKLSKTVNSFVI